MAHSLSLSRKAILVTTVVPLSIDAASPQDIIFGTMTTTCTKEDRGCLSFSLMLDGESHLESM